MTTALWMKEIRALLPIWSACVIALVSGYTLQDGAFAELAVAAFIVGPAALGAHAFGHEYSHRTLATLLAQPIDRRRLFFAKWIVATCMALAVGVLASVVLARFAHGMWQPWTVRVLPVLGGVFMAPWLTLRVRNTLAGVVAATVFFFASLTLPVFFVSIVTGASLGATQARLLIPWSVTMLALCVMSGFFAIRLFTVLEAGDASAASLTLPQLGHARSRGFRPIAALVGKELQLQQLTLLLAMIFLGGSIGLLILQRVLTSFRDAPVGAIMLLYCMLLALVIGALASAEERQLGVAEWQLIQPASARTQWAIKVLVTMSLSVALAAVMPAMLLRVASGIDEPRLLPTLIVPALFLTSGGLYLSSLSNSGTSAMVLTLPAGAALMLFMRFLQRAPLSITSRAVAPASAFAPLVWLIPVLIALAFLNHTSRQRTMTAVASQMIAIAIVLTATQYALLNF